jgi:hypothetical protein
MSDCGALPGDAKNDGVSACGTMVYAGFENKRITVL